MARKNKKKLKKLTKKIEGIGQISINTLYRIHALNKKCKFPDRHVAKMSKWIEDNLEFHDLIVINDYTIGAGLNWRLSKLALTLIIQSYGTKATKGSQTK